MTCTPTHHQRASRRLSPVLNLLSALVELMLSDDLRVTPGSPRSPLAPVHETYENLMSPYMELYWN